MGRCFTPPPALISSTAICRPSAYRSSCRACHGHTTAIVIALSCFAPRSRTGFAATSQPATSTGSAGSITLSAPLESLRHHSLIGFLVRSGELAPRQLVEHALVLHQRLVRAALDDATTVEHLDAVRAHDCAQPMRDHESRHLEV